MTINEFYDSILLLTVHVHCTVYKPSNLSCCKEENDTNRIYTEYCLLFMKENYRKILTGCTRTQRIVYLLLMKMIGKIVKTSGIYTETKYCLLFYKGKLRKILQNILIFFL